MGGGASSNSSEDHLNHAAGVRHRCFVEEPHNPVPSACQPKVALDIASRNLGQVMHAAIQFNDQPMPVANEVDDVGPEGRLSPEV